MVSKWYDDEGWHPAGRLLGKGASINKYWEQPATAEEEATIFRKANPRRERCNGLYTIWEGQEVPP